MKRLGFRHVHVLAGHQDCGICNAQLKARESRGRREGRAEVAAQLTDATEYLSGPVVAIICPVWQGGCSTPELCQDECIDADLD